MSVHDCFYKPKFEKGNQALEAVEYTFKKGEGGRKERKRYHRNEIDQTSGYKAEGRKAGSRSLKRVNSLFFGEGTLEGNKE